MIVKCRVLLSKPWWKRDTDEWERWGVICNSGFSFDKIMVIAPPYEDRHVMRSIEDRAMELDVGIERAEEAFGQYSDRFSLLSKVHEIEGESFGQIVEQLYERYVAAPARSELEAMRQPEEVELDVVAV
jgi:hypothetical protein